MVVIDDNMRRVHSERLALASASVDGRDATPLDGFEIPARIDKIRQVEILAESAPFDRNLYASLDVSVHIPSAASSDSNGESG